MKLGDCIAEHNIWLNDNDQGVQIDFANATFLNERIRSVSLQSSVFEKVEFKEMVFEGCDLTGSSFFDCIFYKCDFRETTLHKCEFHDCRFEGVIFENSQITKSEFNNCILPFAKFSACNLGWSFINNSDLRGGDLINVSLEGAIIADCKLFNMNIHTIDFGKEYPARLQNIDYSAEGDGSKIIQKEEFIKLSKANMTPDTETHR